MEDFERRIRQENLQRQLRIGSSFDDFEKGAVAQEGEIRTHGGIKVKKVGGKWIPVGKGKQKPQRKPDPTPKKKKQEEAKSAPVAEKPQLPKHEVAQLSTIKNLIDKDPGRAHELANNLSDEAKNAIPQDAWNKMSEAAHIGDKQAKQQQEQIDQAIEEQKDEQKRFKKWADKNRKMFDTGEHAHPERSKAAKFLRAKAKGFVKGLKHEIHHIKDVGKVVKKLVTGKTKDISDHEKKSVKKVATSLGLTVATMLATGGVSAFTHGFAAAAKHLAFHFVEHGLVETAGLAAIFAKAQRGEELSDEEDAQLTALIHMFIDWFENGDWSGALDGLEDSENSGEENLNKALVNELTDLIKGKSYPIGTVRTYTDGNKYIKVAEGKWVKKNEFNKNYKKADLSNDTYDFQGIFIGAGLYSAKNEAKKIPGGIVVRLHGTYFACTPIAYQAKLKDLGAKVYGGKAEGKIKEKDIIPPKSKSNNTAEDWHDNYWKDKKPEDIYKEISEPDIINKMSEEKFEGLIEKLISGTADPVLSIIGKENIKAAPGSAEDLMYALRRPSGSKAKAVAAFRKRAGVSYGAACIIHSYTHNMYRPMNRMISGSDPSTPPPHFNDFLSRTVETLEKAVQKANPKEAPPKYDNGNVGWTFRSRSHKKGGLEASNKEMMDAMMNIGGEINYGTVLSTSSTARNSFSASTANAIFYAIKRRAASSKSLNVADISSFGESEREVIFTPSARFRIKSVHIHEDFQGRNIPGLNNSSMKNYKKLIILEEI